VAYIEKRLNAAGKVTGFRVQIRLKGFKPESMTRKKYADAAAWASARENEIRLGRQAVEDREKSVSLSEVIDKYLKNVLPGKSSKERSKGIQAQQLRFWKAEIGAYTMSNLRPLVIAEVRDGLSVDLMPGTVNRYLAALSVVLSYAFKELEVIRENPMKKVSMMREARLRVRFLTDEERIKLLKEAKKQDELLYLYIIMALSTGGRYNEIRRLKWQDVDMEKNRAILHETKNDERRSIFFYGEAYKAMQERLEKRRKAHRSVFASKRVDEPVNLYPSWYRVIDGVDIADFRIHDLRHCFATELARTGHSLKDIAELLGHKNLNMVQRYAHLVDSHASQVVRTMNESLVVR
jgi:integrase